jgi:hypothetical protein
LLNGATGAKVLVPGVVEKKQPGSEAIIPSGKR